LGTALNFNQVTKEFPVVGCVLDRFDAIVPADHFVSLVGPSGCGKSTLLRLILGLDHQTSGEIEFVTDDDSPDHERAIAFQEPRLLPWMTVRQNIELVLHKSTNQKSRVDHLLDLVELSDFGNALPKALSGGMAQRVSLARALANEPDVLLLDEPFSALDALTRLRLQDALIRIYLERPRTTILVTHDIDEALYTSRQVIVLSGRPGRIVDVIDVEADYPRDRADPSLLAAKARILRSLDADLAGAADPYSGERPTLQFNIPPAIR
jgi:ABC-type nitrate/sulfonate/bicarbonate transport system ATPase subunit